MSILAFIGNRRSVGDVQDRLMTEAAVHDVVEAARWAPNAENLQSRTLYFIIDREISNKLVAAALNQHFIEQAPSPSWPVWTGILPCGMATGASICMLSWQGPERASEEAIGRRNGTDGAMRPRPEGRRSFVDKTRFDRKLFAFHGMMS